MHRRTPLAALVALAVTAGLAACTSSDASTSGTSAPPATSATVTDGPDAPATTAVREPSHVIDFTAQDFAYDMPDMGPFAAGMTTINLSNSGKEPHQVQIVRLHDGVTSAQFNAAVATGEDAKISAVSDFMGGTNAVSTGGRASSKIDLPAGEYAALCFIPSPTDNKAHMTKGMVMPFEIIGDESGDPPATDGTVQLKEYQFVLPAGFGHGTYEVKNVGKETHELIVVRLKDGVTFDQALAWFLAGQQGEPLLTFVGGVGGLEPGMTAYADLDLQPGNYVALCFLPGPGGSPHALMGMMQQFTI
jgi:hypothetical protein